MEGKQLELFDKDGNPNPKIYQTTNDIREDVSSSLQNHEPEPTQTEIPNICQMKIDRNNEKLQKAVYDQFQNYPKAKGKRKTIFQKLTTHLNTKRTTFSQKDLVSMAIQIVRHIQRHKNYKKSQLLSTIEKTYTKNIVPYSAKEQSEYKIQNTYNANDNRLREIAEMIIDHYEDFATILAKEYSTNTPPESDDSERTHQDDIHSDYGR